MVKTTSIQDKFLRPYINLVRDVMVPYQWDALNDNVEGAEKSHCIENIKIAAGLAQGEFKGMVFQDSDVAKWIEAVAYCLQDSDDSDVLKTMEKHVDETIDLISKAQCEDGYFNTYYQLTAPDKRFTNLNEAHELYCLGHFIEAAVAYSEVTGKQKILDIFCKYADLVDSVFGDGDGKRKGYPGHQEIELSLTRLFEATGEQRYLDLAAYFINERGQEPSFFSQEWKERDGVSVWSKRKEPCPENYSYSQAHKPVREQTEAVGHAVRAMYMYAAMAEVGRLTDDESLINACENLISDIERQMYVTGGVGSTNHGEAFTFAYDLPNEINYSETCASIGLIFFMKSMLKVKPLSLYADIMERALYNTVLSSIGTDAKTYFYVNPMEVWPDANAVNPARTHVAARRQKWHRCACCPPNAARLLASLQDYLYTVDAPGDVVYFHLYAASRLDAEVNAGKIELSAETEYPLNGALTVRIDNAPKTPVTLAFRIPYHQDNTVPVIMVNGTALTSVVKNGYVCISRIFKQNEVIEFAFDIKPRFVRANSKLRAGAGKVCLERGPLVYCLEQCDNAENLSALIVDTKAGVQTDETGRNIDNIPYVTLTAKGYRETDSDDKVYTYEEKSLVPCDLTFVPYHLWGNRFPGEEMLVWIREINR